MHAKKTNKRRLAALLLALALLMGCAAGATLAWLIDTTDPIVNTFTVGDINITLTEDGAENNAKSFKMIPGTDIAKDPTVTVEGGSEDCWLFVKVETANGVALENTEGKYLATDYITYTVDGGWALLDGQNGVYYREVKDITADKPFAILKDNKVHVLDTVTKEMMNGLTEGKYPTLTFTAYAVQSANIDSAADAWSVATTGKLPTTTP